MAPPQFAFGGVIGGEEAGGGEKNQGAAVHFLGVTQAVKALATSAWQKPVRTSFRAAGQSLIRGDLNGS